MTYARPGRSAALPGSLLAGVLASILLLGGCGGGGSIDNELAFRIIHASPDSPPVNLLVDGVTLRSNVDYKGGTGYIFVTPADYDFEVQALLPGDTAPLVDVPATPLAAGREYTLIAIGRYADDSVVPLVWSEPIADIPDGNARLQFVHAVPGAVAVQVYITEPGALLTGLSPQFQASFGDTPGERQLIPTGTYEIRVTPVGDPTTVLFDSSDITLSNRTDFLLVAAQNTGAGPAPISLLVNNRFTTGELLDRNTPSDFRVLHLAPDAPAINVIGDPSTEGAADVSFATGLTYLGDGGYVSVPADGYTVRGVLASDPTPETPPFSFLVGLGAGQRRTLLVTGLVAGLTPTALSDDIRPVFSTGKLRIVDGAPGSGTVDVYVREPGTDLATVDPSVRNLVLRSATAHLGFVPGTYTVTFTEAGTKTVLATADVAADAGTVHTAILVDAVRAAPEDDGKPPSVLVIDDLAD